MLRFSSLNQVHSNGSNSNKVVTTRYTIFSWAPKSLFLQFRRVANVYFLMISVLTSMPFSPKKPQSMLGTFAIVLFFTMLKDAWEDYQRYKSDNELNNREAEVFSSARGGFFEKKW